MEIRKNRMCVVKVNVFALSGVDLAFESRSGQTKEYKMCICYFSAKQAVMRIMIRLTQLL